MSANNGMQYDPIKGQDQGHRGQKWRKWPISKSVSFIIHVIKIDGAF